MPTDPSYFDSPRAKLLWAMVGLLVMVQMVALYMLCDSQMDKARQRQAALHLQQVAINDCLQYSPDTTIGACIRRAAAVRGDSGLPRGADTPQGADTLAAAPQVLSTAMPVSFSYR